MILQTIYYQLPITQNTPQLLVLLDKSNLTFIFYIFFGQHVRVVELFPHEFWKQILGKWIKYCSRNADQTFCLLTTQSTTRTSFTKEQIVAALGRLLALGWVFLKEPQGSPWGFVPIRFNPKYTRIHVRVLSYHFKHKTTHKTYQHILEYTSTFQVYVSNFLGCFTSKPFQINHTYYKTLY